MFKLVKNLNSSSTVPEPVIMLADSTNAFVCGDFLAYSGTAATMSATTVKPLYYCMKNRSLSEPNVVCGTILPSMIFETTLSTDSSITIHAGDKLKMANKNGRCALCVPETGGVATVYDPCGASKAGDKILVRFV